jgi:hypothetical protein
MARSEYAMFPFLRQVRVAVHLGPRQFRSHLAATGLPNSNLEMGGFRRPTQEFFDPYKLPNPFPSYVRVNSDKMQKIARGNPCRRRASVPSC